VADVVAALDCGSNSTRLLVANAQGALRREMRITRLSEGVDATATLLETAMQRTFDVLGDYRRLMDETKVERGLLVATSAVRDARNGEQFLARAQRIVGVEARILDGHEEATLSYEGATIGLEPDACATLIVDIGGGSSELAVMVEGVLESFSMQLGCVRITERALGSAAVDAAHDTAARSMIEAEIERAFSLQPAFARVAGNVRLVGLAGTVATLAQLDAGLVTYRRELVHHRVLTRDCVEWWRSTLAAESAQERLGHPGMVKGREDVLTAGLYVLEAVMDRFGADELLTSENDILDGIAQSLLA
jgi:exopolyphosphatase/guanosine-5'-triphosphate,3'-diphosphate pyrophosphatase